jgi:hypothetical protein
VDGRAPAPQAAEYNIVVTKPGSEPLTEDILWNVDFAVLKKGTFYTYAYIMYIHKRAICTYINTCSYIYAPTMEDAASSVHGLVMGLQHVPSTHRVEGWVASGSGLDASETRHFFYFYHKLTLAPDQLYNCKNLSRANCY